MSDHDRAELAKAAVYLNDVAYRYEQTNSIGNHTEARVCRRMASAIGRVLSQLTITAADIEAVVAAEAAEGER